MSNTTDLALFPLLIVVFIGDGITDDIPSSKNSSRPMIRVAGLLLLFLRLLPDPLLPDPAVLGLCFPRRLELCPLARINRLRAADFLFS